MKTLRVLMPMLALCLVTPVFSQSPSTGDKQKAKALRTELEGVRSEIEAAEEKISSLEGALVSSMVEIRLETLKNTEALIKQHIQALESGASINFEVPGTVPNEELAEQLHQELDTQLAELDRASQEADKYGGGLVGSMKQTIVATQEQSIAMLRQRYLAAKYGLPMMTLAEASAMKPGSDAPATQPSSTHSANNNSNKTPDDPEDNPKEIISVRLLDKWYAEQDYQDYIWFDLEFTAVNLDKPARAIKGVLVISDLFGETQMTIKWTLDETMEPGQTVVEEGTGFKYNQFMDPHQWVRNTERKNMSTRFIVESILYQDGSRRD